MANKGKKNTKEQDELWESSEVLAETLVSGPEKFMQEHKGLVGIILAVVTIGLLGFFGYKYYNNNLNNTAQSEMFQAVYYYEQDSLEKALRGDGNVLGLVNITEDYKGTDAANLANFYVGDIYLKQGKFDLARLYLEDFSSSDLVLQGRAYGLLGDTYMSQSNFDLALDYYKKAISYQPNKEFTPTYLKKAAIAYENKGDLEKAKECYKRIIDEFKGSAMVTDAKKHYARLGGLNS